MSKQRVLVAVVATVLAACAVENDASSDVDLEQTRAALEERKVLHQVCTQPSCNNYWFALPAGHETSPGPFPLIIYLHGSGERTNGTPDGNCPSGGTNFKCVTAAGPLKHVNDGSWPADYPFIVVAPQTLAWGFDYPQDGDHTVNRETEALVRDVSARFKVDPTRIYLTGWSMGAGGSLAAAARYPELFAAVVPVAGKWPKIPGYAVCDMAGIPLWGFHAQNDTVIHWSHTRWLVDALNTCSPGSAQGTYPSTGGHAVAHTVYREFGTSLNGTNIYAWMLTHRKQGGAALLSQGRPVSASSVHEGFAPANAVDGVISDASRWVSASGAPGTQWLEIDLQQSRTIRHARLFTGYIDRFAITSAQLELWNGTDWTTVASFSGNAATNQIVDLTLSAPVVASRARIRSQDTGHTRIRELQIYGN